MGAFDDLIPAGKAGGAFDDLVPAKPAPRPSLLKRAAVNAEAAFYGADGDSGGLLSESVIGVDSGKLFSDSADTNRTFGKIARTIGLDGVAAYFDERGNRLDAKAARAAAKFSIEQRGRREAVQNLGPAEGLAEKAVDIGGRIAASVPQPENFIGGPALKGMSLGKKLLTGAGTAAVVNAAVEPVLQSASVERGTRQAMSLKDAAINTGVAAATGGVFGGVAHGVEKLTGKAPAPDAPRSSPAQSSGAFDDLVPPKPAGAFDDLIPGRMQARTVEADGVRRTATVRPSRRPVLAAGEPLPAGMARTAVLRDGSVRRSSPEAAVPIGAGPNFNSQQPPTIAAEVGGLAAENALDATLGDMVSPDDVVPLRGRLPRTPDSRVGSLEEAERANPSSIEPLTAPDERDALPTYRLASRSDPRQFTTRRNPLDLVGFIRRKGGLRDGGGELTHAGIDNSPRRIDFAKDEGFLGRLVDPENGRDLDEMAELAWEAGYFPGHTSRPDVSEFLDALVKTHRGEPDRVFHPNDWEDIDNYHATLGDRMRIEQAEREGVPLAVERGEPAGLDDLDARTPPAEVYRADLPPMPEKAGNIRTDLLDSPQSIHRALRTIANAADGFDAARRGVMRQEHTKALAEEMGMTAQDLLRRRKGQALNAEQALAARQLLAKSGNELVALAKRTQGGSDEDLAAFRAALLRHAAIQEQVAGMTAEAGRTLAQFRMVADSRDVRGPVIRGEVLKTIIDGAGGRDSIEDVAKKLLDVEGEPAKLNKLALTAAKPSLKDKLFEVYYSFLLSGPRTHVVNVLSNALTAGLQIPETATAAAIGKLRGGAADRVLFSEVGARVVGLVQGAQEGLSAAAKAFRTGNPSDFVTKLEVDQYRAISGKKGEAIRLPMRALTAEDEFFKSVARRMELNALAVRKAGTSGKKGAERRAYAAELAANPTPDMIEQAVDFGRYLTFQQKLGPAGQMWMGFASKQPIAKWLLPFVRTPINLMKFAAERSPLAAFMPSWWRDLKAGGAKRDVALAKVTFGTGIGVMVAQWAAEGVITGGGPSDPEQRRMMMADGWQPYSIRLGRKWYSYARLDPLASTLGAAADLAEVSRYLPDAEVQDAAARLGLSILRNLTAGDWLQTLGNVSEALLDPDRSLDKFLASEAGKLVPAAVGQLAQATDPVLREAREPIERMKSRIPGLSASLLPRRDVWGRPIDNEGGAGPDLVSPFKQSKADKDSLSRELFKIGAEIGRLPRKIGKVALTGLEYDVYQEAAGRLSRQYVEEEMRSGWTDLSKAEKVEAVKQAVRDARAEARDAMLERFPHLDVE